MRLLLILFACSIYASPVVEVRFIGPSGDRENDRFSGALFVEELQKRMGDRCLVSFEVGDALHFGERFTIHLSGDPDMAEDLFTYFFEEMEQIEQGEDDFCKWVATLRSETMPSVEYFVSDRGLWEELRGAKPFTGNRAEMLSYLEQLGYKDIDFQPYKDLYAKDLTGVEQEAISYILNCLADDSIFTLGVKTVELKRRGKQIEHVHPLVFLGFIASSPHLQEKFHKVAERRFTWKPWVDGFVGNMRLYTEKGEMLDYFPGFCYHTGADPMAVRAFLKQQDYEGLMRYFF